MTDLAVLVPTRGRPANARRLSDAIHATAPDAVLVFGLDHDDPTLDEYHELSEPWVSLMTWGRCGPPGMVSVLNRIAQQIPDDVRYVGFMGDDHLPRTEGWDRLLCEAIERQGGGIAYGDDLVHGQNLATACVMDARIPQTLGYMAPPALAHLYADNTWLDWGRALGKLAYRSDVVIEHLHPLVGKGEWDDGYATVNAAPATERDRVAYEQYRDGGGLAADIEKLRAI